MPSNGCQWEKPLKQVHSYRYLGARFNSDTLSNEEITKKED